MKHKEFKYLLQHTESLPEKGQSICNTFKGTLPSQWRKYANEFALLVAKTFDHLLKSADKKVKLVKR